MDSDKLIELYLKIIQRVEFYWNFYTIAFIALVGWFVSMDKPFTVGVKILIAIAYVMFACMNVIALHGSYIVLEALRKDVVLQLAEQKQKFQYSYPLLEKVSYSRQRIFTYIIPLVLGVTVLCIIFFAKLGG